jgi:hypothetical protein
MRADFQTFPWYGSNVVNFSDRLHKSLNIRWFIDRLCDCSVAAFVDLLYSGLSRLINQLKRRTFFLQKAAQPLLLSMHDRSSRAMGNWVPSVRAGWLGENFKWLQTSFADR